MRVPAAALAVILAMLLTGCGSPSLEATPTPGRSGEPTPSSAADSNGTAAPSFSKPATPMPVLDAPALVDSVRLASIEAHLAAFQAIADANGGQRGSGSPGYLASVRYVTDALLAAGYAPELEVLTEGGRELTNVIAERTGTAPGRVVVIGAHLDSVAVGPGINDNASGVAVILAIAAALSEQPAHPVTVRLAFWDAEEGGPFGSAAHVGGLSAEEADRIKAYLNLDMVGSPNAVPAVYSDGAPRLARLLRRLHPGREAGALTGNRSDHAPFESAGVPVNGLYTGANEDGPGGRPRDRCYHLPCDRLANVDRDVLLRMARTTARALLVLATGEG
jgi:aminopeptidase S